MCCLRYENQLYTSGELKCCNCQQKGCEQQKPPAVGKRVMTDEGVGTVLRVHMKDHTVKVQLESGHNINVPWSDVGKRNMNIELGPHERLDDLVLDGMKVIQRDDQFCFSLDTVLLAHFGAVPHGPALDLGTGTAAIPSS